jgi:aconitate hydratase 2/2-methylisocitrate dehydratase
LLRNPAIRSGTAAICSRLGRILPKDEYLAGVGVLAASSSTIYRTLNFDRIEEFKVVADTVGA